MPKYLLTVEELEVNYYEVIANSIEEAKNSPDKWEFHSYYDSYDTRVAHIEEVKE